MTTPIAKGPATRLRELEQRLRRLQIASMGLCVLSVAALCLFTYEHGRVDGLNDQVKCLRHPTHAASSTTAVRLPDGTFKTVQPAYGTVC